MATGYSTTRLPIAKSRMQELSRARGAFWDSAKARVQRNKICELVPFKPNNHDVAELRGALQDVTHVPRETLSPPCWLPGTAETRPPGTECISFTNGILHLPTGCLYEPDPEPPPGLPEAPALERMEP